MRFTPYPLLGRDPLRWPDPESAGEDGIVAMGGDLSTPRLVAAYARGIFPWYSEGLPILWHSPDPRFVLLPEKLHVPKSLEKQLRRGRYEVRLVWKKKSKVIPVEVRGGKSATVSYDFR